MKKGTEPIYSGREEIGWNHLDQPVRWKNHVGISIRLEIASRAMCAMISNSNANRVYEEPNNLVEEALKMTDLLIKMEEETR